MRKHFFATIIGVLPLFAFAQGAIDAYQVSQTDLRGTARFMSMAGAFGALGGDLSTLNQNPAGIGVYRSSDISLTMGFDMQSTSVASNGDKYGTTNQFKVNCNNAGYIGTFKLNSDAMPNINWGFTYNRATSFNRRYSGGIRGLNTSLTNYIAGFTNAGQYTEADLTTRFNDNDEIVYDPYNNKPYAPWLSILAYDSYLINSDSGGKNFQGLYGNGTTGSAEFETIESGGVNEFNINWGGNIANIVYWGMGFGITDISYQANTYYGESLDNAYIDTQNGRGTAVWGLSNALSTVGTGYNFKMGVIVKPMNELRLGFAFHTPTYYNLQDRYYANTLSNYDRGEDIFAETNNGWDGEGWYKINTPWKFIASAATIIGGKAILSFDYEYVGFNTMQILDNIGQQYVDRNNYIQAYYQASNIFRVGGEFRVTPQFSVRAGYSYQSSPVKETIRNNSENIITVGTIPSYTFDNSIQYITAGLGYRYKAMYVDAAYVHKTRKSDYHAFSPVVPIEESPVASITDNNNQIVFTLGFRF